MGRGLQIFDENGQEVFNSSTRTLQIIKKIDFKVNSSVTISHSLFNKDSGMTPIVIASPSYFGGSIVDIVHLGGDSIRLDMNEGSIFEFVDINRVNYFNDYDNITLLVGVY